jgi:N-acetylneuraminate lyase
MMLSGLAVGVNGAVGSTYNFAAPLYRRLIDAFGRCDVDEARRCQGLAVAMVRAIVHYRFHAGLKATMSLIGLDCGPTRLPTLALNPQELASMRRELDAIGFFQWATMPKEEVASPVERGA